MLICSKQESLQTASCSSHLLCYQETCLEQTSSTIQVDAEATKDLFTLWVRLNIQIEELQPAKPCQMLQSHLKPDHQFQMLNNTEAKNYMFFFPNSHRNTLEIPPSDQLQIPSIGSRTQPSFQCPPTHLRIDLGSKYRALKASFRITPCLRKKSILRFTSTPALS